MTLLGCISTLYPGVISPTWTCAHFQWRRVRAAGAHRTPTVDRCAAHALEFYRAAPGRAGNARDCRLSASAGCGLSPLLPLVRCCGGTPWGWQLTCWQLQRPRLQRLRLGRSSGAEPPLARLAASIAHRGGHGVSARVRRGGGRPGRPGGPGPTPPRHARDSAAGGAARRRDTGGPRSPESRQLASQAMRRARGAARPARPGRRPAGSMYGIDPGCWNVEL